MADRSATGAAHAAHDPLVVAEAADSAGALPPELAACPDCTALHADLVSLASALPTSALPPRPRDYTLTPADAARLRPGGWRRLLAAIGSSRDVVTRPLAIGFTTLGLAGLLVATVPGALPGGTAGAAPDPQDAGRVQELQAGAPAATGSGDATGGGTLGQVEDGSAPSPGDRSTASGPPTLAIASAGLLVAGGGLFVVRRVAARSRAS